MANIPEDASKKLMQTVKKLLAAVPKTKAEMKIELNKRGNAITQFIKAREIDAQYMNMLDAQKKAAMAYIAVLAFSIEDYEHDLNGTAIDNAFELAIPKEALTDAIKNVDVSWREEQETGNILLRVIRKKEGNTQNEDGAENKGASDTKGDNDSSSGPEGTEPELRPQKLDRSEEAGPH